ncbi:tRNA pseudouridine(55) synthase TruB [Paenibacillus sp. GCM10027626]|uniref:tRNA pseudouridine(55) synthase TruB n=1 Tax=Paenibacillus sp. GCM10027626 TaxID=3273411 RepID=UPI00363ED7C7
MMDGILVVWKPAGWTSHDVVAKARRLLRVKRIGHTGTLDPQVTGVLPLCIGRATRVVEYVQERPKTYEATLCLGVATDTEDLTGTIIDSVPEVRITEDEVRQALASFVGEIEQVPPMYSAVRVDGKRLYELAREGQVVERAARKVKIYSLNLLSFEDKGPHPRIRFSVECSKGTYIRTLCVDIGKRLGLPAAMAELVRTQSGGFVREQCLTLEQIEQLQANNSLADKLIPADAALSHMPKGIVSDLAATQAFQGKPVDQGQVEWAGKAEPGEIVRLYGHSGLFVGLFQSGTESSLLKPIKVFTPIE